MAEFYTAEEAMAKLSLDEAGLRSLVVEGKLREFRQEGQVQYAAEDVDTLASGESDTGQAGELILEPAGTPPAGLDAEGTPLTGMDLTGGGDVLSLAEEEEKEKESAAEQKEPSKDDTVVTSIGVSVFEEDELELDADPAAKTVLSGSGGGGMASLEGSGGGSGLLDLTRESDDTSLGAELLDEIYPEEGAEGSGAGSGIIGDATQAGIAEEMKSSAGSQAAMGSAGRTGTRAGTRAGTRTGTAGGSGAEMGSGTALAMEDIAGGGEAAAAPAAAVVPTGPMVTIEDPYTGAFTGVMLVTVFVLATAGAASAAFLSGTWPSYLDWIGRNILLFGGVALGATVVVLLVGFMVARPKGPAKPKKEKTPKAKKEKKQKEPKPKKEKKAKKK
jgi:hypothetical protein